MRGLMCWLGLMVLAISPSSSVQEAAAYKGDASSAFPSGQEDGDIVFPPSTLSDAECKEYVQRYLQEAISGLNQQSTNFTSLKESVKAMRVMTTLSEVKAKNLTNGMKEEVEQVLKVIDSARSAALEKTPDCAAKGDSIRAELIKDVDKKIDTALKTYEEFDSKLSVITCRLIANSIDASITKMQNCVKNKNVNKKNVRSIIYCINNVTNNFDVSLNTDREQVEVLARQIKELNDLILTDLDSTFSEIKLETGNRAKSGAEDVIKCVKQLKANTCIESNNKTITLTVGELQDTLDKLETDLKNSKQNAVNYVNDKQSKIDDAVKPLAVAINTTLSVSPNTDLTEQQQLLKRLTSEAEAKTNITAMVEIIKHLNDMFAVNGNYSDLLNEFKTKVEKLRDIDFNTRCNLETASDEEFCSCVENIYNDFSNSFKIINSKISDLLNNAANLKVEIDNIINSDTVIDLISIYNICDSTANDIYDNNKITDKDIIDYALLNSYNVTPILKVVSQLYNLGKDLENKKNYAWSSSNYSIFTSGSAIYDIVGPGRALCGQKSVDERLKMVRKLIQERTEYVFSKFPDLSATISHLLQQSNDVNTTLFNQIALLNADRLKEVCPQASPGNRKKLFELYKCIDSEVKKFGVYYDGENVNIQNYIKDAQDKVKQHLEELKNWRATKVVPEATAIAGQLKDESESFYRECNATVEKLINFSLNVAKSYYNSFQSKITATHAEVIALSDLVLSKDYSGFNLTEGLEAASQPVLTAIKAFSSSNVSNENTISEFNTALAYLVSNATDDFRKVIANFSIQSKSYVDKAAALVSKRDEIYNNHTYDYLYHLCYNSSSSYPFSDLVSCTTPTTYKNTFLIGNNTLTALLGFKKELDNFNSNSEQIIKDAAERILKEFSLSAYFFAFKIYKTAGLPVPPDVLAQVEGKRCLQGVTTNQYYCVVNT